VTAHAASLVVPASPALAQFTAGTLSAADLLHVDLATRDDTRAMAVAVGARTFTVRSLIRMRCAGEDSRHLATSLSATEASCYFQDFPADLRDLQVQQRFAVALDACRPELSDVTGRTSARQPPR
jgi:hypothetical protein